MKKTLKLLGLVALAAIAFSCTKDADSNNSGKPETPAGETEQPQTPGGQDSSDYLLSFGADIVSPFDTKATIDLVNKTVSFDDGDMVLVVNGTDAKTYVYEGAEFKAESDAVSLEGTIHAYYPASAYNVDTEGNVTFTMPEYLGSLADIGDKAPMAGVIAKEGNDYKASFKNVASILEVSITGDRKLNTLQLTNTGKPISKEASFTVSWNEGDPALSTEAADHATSILEVNEVLSSEAKTYYFILPAGNYEGVQIRANMEGVDANGISSYVLNRGDWDGVLRNKIYKVSFRAGLFSGGSGKPEDPYLIANVRDFKNIHNYTTNGYDGGSKLDAAHFLGASYKQTAGISFGTAEKKGDLSSYMIASASAAFTGTYDGDNKTLSNFTITHTPENGDRDGAALFQNVNGAVLKNISITGAEVTGGKFTAGLVGYATGDGLSISGCSISNSTISGSDSYGAAGLIGGLYAGTVAGCSGTDLTIAATNNSSKQHFGGLVSYVRGSTTVINGCSLNGTTTVNGTAVYFGGIVGHTNNDDGILVTDCHNHSDISGVGNFAGGIVGRKSKGSIQGCTNDGSVGGAQYVGGIVGRNEDGMILGCTNEGAIVSTGYAGGIAGQVTGGTIKDCTNESAATFTVTGNYFGGIVGSITGGTITASDGKYTENKAAINTTRSTVGGIAGEVKADISNVKCTASVTGAYHVGGIAGQVLQNGTVTNAIVTGDVSGTQNVGGIAGTIGHNDDNTSATISKKIKLVNCHVDGADITASADDSRAGGIAGLVRAGAWIEGCTAFRGTVSGHQDVGGAIGNLQYASKSTDKSNRIFVGANLVSMEVSGIAPIQSTSRIGGFVGFFQNNAKNYTFVYQNGVVGGSITAEGCEYVGSFVGYASSSDNKGRIYDSYSLIEDANFHVTTTNAHIGGFAGEYGNANVDSKRNAHVNSQNTSTSTTGITNTTVDAIRTVNLGTSENPTCNVDGSNYTTTTWSNPVDVNYPVPTILVTYGHYK